MESRIIYKPVRSNVQKITDVRKSEVVLHSNYLESIISYDWESTDSNGVENDATMIPKIGLTVSRTETESRSEPDTFRPTVIIDHAGLTNAVYITCASNKEADEVYIKIRNWILAQ